MNLKLTNIRRLCSSWTRSFSWGQSSVYTTPSSRTTCNRILFCSFSLSPEVGLKERRGQAAWISHPRLRNFTRFYIPLTEGFHLPWPTWIQLRLPEWWIFNDSPGNFKPEKKKILILKLADKVYIQNIIR